MIIDIWSKFLILIKLALKWLCSGRAILYLCYLCTMIKLDEVRIKLFRGDAINQQEAEALSRVEDKIALYKLAGEVRERFTGNIIDTCSIVNAKSGMCEEDCKWCAQSAHHNSSVDSYQLVDTKNVLDQAKANAQNGVKRFSLVSSGRALSNKIMNKIIGIYKEIQTQTNLELCASFGLISTEQLEQLKETGVTNYHCNLETSRSFFSMLSSTHSYDEKIAVIKAAQKADLSVCSGGIIGMGETMEQRIELAFELRNLGVRSVPLNILQPVEGTPLEGTESLSDEEILTTFALFRLILPDANIRFSGGKNKIKHIQQQALKNGIDAALVGDLLTSVGSDIEEFKMAGYEL